MEISNLTIKCNNKEIISNANLTLYENEIKGLTGPSGSGKTTLLKTIMSLNDFNSRVIDGKIQVNEIDITKMPFKQIKKYLGTLIGYIPQNPMTSFFRHKTVEYQLITNLAIRKEISRLQAKKIIVDNISKMNFEDPVRILKSYPTELSGGMLQRLAIVNVLAMDAKIILADEPTSALDYHNKNILLKSLLELREKSSILFVSHDIDTMKKICDSISIMLNGTIVFDEKKVDLSNKKKLFEDLWIKDFLVELNTNNEENWSWKNLL